MSYQTPKKTKKKTRNKEKKMNSITCGVDEAGRGSLLYDVFSAAVIVPNWFEKKALDEKVIIRDSKKMSEKQRDKSRIFIEKNAISYGIGRKSSKEIDKMNIRNATVSSMNHALLNLNPENLPTIVYVDGDHFENQTNWNHDCEFKTVIQGDNQYIQIAAASILAKTHRDEAIYKLVDEFPFLQNQYHIKQNKGYGTALHLKGIREFGISQFHRETFCKKFGPIYLKSFRKKKSFELLKKKSLKNKIN